MLKFSVDGKLYLQNYLTHIKRDFAASAISEDEVQETIARYYREYHYILDPHTAVGVRAAEQHCDQGVAMVCLATAHPAKFGSTVEQAIGKQPDLPPSLAELEGKPSRCEVLDCSIEALMAYVESHALSRP